MKKFTFAQVVAFINAQPAEKPVNYGESVRNRYPPKEGYCVMFQFFESVLKETEFRMVSFDGSMALSGFGCEPVAEIIDMPFPARNMHVFENYTKMVVNFGGVQKLIANLLPR